MSAGWSAGGMAGWRLDRNRIPWMKGYRAGTRHLSVLSEELDAFATFVPSPRRGVAEVEARVRAAVKAVCCTAEATPGAAASAGITVPEQPYRMDVSGLWASEEVSAFCCLLEAEGYSVEARSPADGGEVEDVLVTAPEAPGSVQPRASCLLSVGKVAASDGGDGRAAAAAALAAEVAQRGEVRRVAQVLTHVLWQSSLLGEQKGLGVAALIAMVAAVRRGLPDDASCDDAALLHATLTYFGTQFDPAMAMVTPHGARPKPPCLTPRLSGGLWVCHPTDPSANLADGCSCLPRIKGLFLHCSAALRRWDAPLPPGGGGGVRGKSPLASVIAFNRLSVAYLLHTTRPPPATPSAPRALSPPRRAAEGAPTECGTAGSGGSLSATTDDGSEAPELAHDDGPPLLLLAEDEGPPQLIQQDGKEQRRGGSWRPRGARGRGRAARARMGGHAQPPPALRPQRGVVMAGVPSATMTATAAP